MKFEQVRKLVAEQLREGGCDLEIINGAFRAADLDELRAVLELAGFSNVDAYDFILNCVLEQ